MFKIISHFIDVIYLCVLLCIVGSSNESSSISTPFSLLTLYPFSRHSPLYPFQKLTTVAISGRDSYWLSDYLSITIL